MSEQWQFLVALNEQFRRLTDPVAIQQTAVRLIGEHFGASRVNYARIEGDEYVLNQCFVNGVPAFADRGPVARFGASVVDACRRGETVAIDDTRTDPRLTDAERAELRRSQIGAFIGAPLLKGGQWIAVFGVHSEAPRS